ncbi:glycosyltransferase [Bradyrhizobium ontarionense]|uniref:Glycosyltransferase n=1 Tax=Bradyrhizobium ontarionense TaxID=2898149 RepID=A0ABY3RDE7_9BRAD|nr:glycosyltransferase [Bradyrhizobium sp. A19]UFZ04777.1 glycosyltransferase [Bradyrhizobium sp. A19]
MISPPVKPRVLVFSLRNIFGRALNRCPHYEFEDIICEIDSAELLAPTVDPASRRASVATRLGYHAPLALNPGIPKPQAKGPYDLLFTICGFPQDLIMFNAVSNLRDVCKTSVCLLDELWARDIHKHRHFLPILAKFDVVMQYHSQTVKPLSDVIGPRCRYLAPGVDATLFCPYPDPPERAIDVYSMGRRPKLTHQKLLSMARDSGLFYVHDTISGSQAIDSREHRAQIANLAKRSRYFLVNSGKFDSPEETGHQVEFGYRYFEGAASGAIMLGERPNNEVFPKLFDWPDAVIQVPPDSGEIDRAIRELDREPERQDRIRRTGVAQALMRHDWAYRWEAILDAAGLQPLPGLAARKQRLKTLAETASGHSPMSSPAEFDLIGS